MAKQHVGPALFAFLPKTNNSAKKKGDVQTYTRCASLNASSSKLYKPNDDQGKILTDQATEGKSKAPTKKIIVRKPVSNGSTLLCPIRGSKYFSSPPLYSTSKVGKIKFQSGNLRI